MKVFLRVVTVLLVFLSISPFTGASSENVVRICDLEVLKVDEIRGIVTMKGDHIVSDSFSYELRLKKIEGDSEIDVIQSSISKGSFRFPRLQKGKYRLLLFAMSKGEYLTSGYNFILKVASKRPRESSQQLLVDLGFDCHESTVSLVAPSRIDAITKSGKSN